MNSLDWARFMFGDTLTEEELKKVMIPITTPTEADVDLAQDYVDHLWADAPPSYTSHVESVAQAIASTRAETEREIAEALRRIDFPTPALFVESGSYKEKTDD